MNEKEIENRLTKVEERCKSNTHQIEDLKGVVDEIHTLANTQVKLIEQMKSTNDNVEKINHKLEILENEPRENMNKIKLAIITSIISVLIGALLGALIKFI